MFVYHTSKFSLVNLTIWYRVQIPLSLPHHECDARHALGESHGSEGKCNIVVAGIYPLLNMLNRKKAFNAEGRLLRESSSGVTLFRRVTPP